MKKKKKKKEKKKKRIKRSHKRENERSKKEEEEGSKSRKVDLERIQVRETAFLLVTPRFFGCWRERDSSRPFEILELLSRTLVPGPSNEALALGEQLPEQINRHPRISVSRDPAESRENEMANFRKP